MVSVMVWCRFMTRESGPGRGEVAVLVVRLAMTCRRQQDNAKIMLLTTAKVENPTIPRAATGSFVLMDHSAVDQVTGYPRAQSVPL